MQQDHTSVHRAEHTSDEAVDTPTLLHQRNERRYTAFVACGVTEVSEDHPLEGVDLVLQTHEVGDGLVSWATDQNTRQTLGKSRDAHCSPFIGIVNTLQCHVFLVLKQPVELGPQPMEPKFRQYELDIRSDQGPVAYSLCSVA